MVNNIKKFIRGRIVKQKIYNEIVCLEVTPESQCNSYYIEKNEPNEIKQKENANTVIILDTKSGVIVTLYPAD